MNTETLSRGQLAAYAAFAVPLAMAALPVYVHVPKLYGDSLGVPLAVVGAVLLLARLFDALQDPLLGYFSDRCAGLPAGRRLPIVIGLPFLAAGFVALFHPPAASPTGLAIWLGTSLLIVYVGFSMASISYLALGAELSADYHQRTRVTATRGAFGLFGVLVAASAPLLLASQAEGEGLALLSIMFLPVLGIAAAITLWLGPQPVPAPAEAGAKAIASIMMALRNPQFRWLVAVFVVSGIAGAVPGTLILFFVQDVLGRPDLSGYFLALYFLMGAAGMPLWIAASRSLGKKRAWACSMLVAIAAFIWAYFLGPGEVAAFSIVCAMSGIAYGAELAIPASMLADVVDQHADPERARPDGVYFGLWQMMEKINLALAAGIALPLLGLLGYQPGTDQPKTGVLSVTYALLPCAIKLIAAALLLMAPLDGRRVISKHLLREAIKP